MRRALLPSFALVSGLFGLLAGCGDAAEPDVGAANAGTGTTTMAAAVTTTASCPRAPFTGDLRLADEMEPALPLIEEPAHEFTDAVAVRLTPGAYTLYLADYDLDPTAFESLLYEPPAPPDGDVLVTVLVTAFDAITPPPALVAGSDVPVTDEPGAQTLGLIAHGAAGSYNAAADAVGLLTVLDVDDSQICVEVDYTDYTSGGQVQKRLAAAFTADVVALG